MASNKRWFKSAFDANAIQNNTPMKKVEPSPKKFKIEDSFSFKEPFAVANSPNSKDYDTIANINWMKNMTPRETADLAVHQKKLEEIQQWFKTYENVDNDPAAILLISGPPGTGKYVTIKTVAKELGYEISEWTTPVDVDLFYKDTYDFENNDEFTFRENQRDKFDKFLYKSSRYTSLFENNDKRLLIVQDYPNSFLRDPASFHLSLEKYIESSASPLVFLATETSNKKLDIIHNLFRANIQNDYKIHHISFNAVSTTLMKKAMKRILAIMQQKHLCKYYKCPSQETIDSIILSAQGDLRNATINLHFASLKNSPKLPMESVSNNEVFNISGTAKAKKGKGKNTKLKSVGCDENVTMMHALGRVFHPKYQMNDDNLECFYHSPEDLSDSFLPQPYSLISLVHSNYVTRFSEIDDIVGAADALSYADIIMSDYREDLLTSHGLNIILRGMMVNNRKPAGGWKPIRGNKSYTKPSVQNHDRQLTHAGLQNSSISSGLYITDYKKYVDIIRRSTLQNLQNVTESP